MCGVSKLLAGRFGGTKARRYLSASYNKLGGIRKEEGQLTAAKEYCERALEIDRQLYEETGTVEARRDLSVSYDKLGRISAADYHEVCLNMLSVLGWPADLVPYDKLTEGEKQKDRDNIRVLLSIY